MKSLKRTLCLVLALVMVLGLFGIASATSFTDDNTIQYKEAVDVMTAIGAIDGMGDGTFAPKGTITRAQAAKLVTYAVLGKTTADRLVGSTTSSFTDVTAAYSWAIPSIEYLVKEGVINGRGDGTFDPNGQITSTATLKMLLCALGYGKKGEYTGTGWDLQVVLDANKYGLTKGRTSTASVETAATREEVALYCFNTIQTPLVEYISTLDIYATSSSSLGNKLGTIKTNVYGASNGNLTVKEAADGGEDAFGAPANVWTYKGDTIGSYAVPATFTYTTAKTAADLTKELKGYTVRAYAAAVPSVSEEVPAVNAVVNGYTGDVITTANLITKLATDAGGLAGFGTTVKIYANDAKVIQNVVVIKELLTSVDTIDTATGNITLDVESAAPVAANVNAVTKENSAYNVVAGAAKDDYVVVVPVYNTTTATYDVASAYIPTQTTGKITTVTTTGIVYVNGTTAYPKAAAGSSAVASIGVDDKTEATLWLSSTGSILHCKDNAAKTAAFVWVLDVSQTLANNKIVEMADVVYSDGTTGTIPVKDVAGAAVAAGPYNVVKVKDSVYLLDNDAAPVGSAEANDGSILADATNGSSTPKTVTVNYTTTTGSLSAKYAYVALKSTGAIDATDKALTKAAAESDNTSNTDKFYKNFYAADVKFIYTDATTKTVKTVATGVQPVTSIPASSVAVVEKNAAGVYVVTAVILPDGTPATTTDPSNIAFFPSTTPIRTTLMADATGKNVAVKVYTGFVGTEKREIAVANDTVLDAVGFYDMGANSAVPNTVNVADHTSANKASTLVGKTVEATTGATGTTLLTIDSANSGGTVLTTAAAKFVDCRTDAQKLAFPISMDVEGIVAACDKGALTGSVLYDATNNNATVVYITGAAMNRSVAAATLGTGMDSNITIKTQNATTVADGSTYTIVVTAGKGTAKGTLTLTATGASSVKYDDGSEHDGNSIAVAAIDAGSGTAKDYTFTVTVNGANVTANTLTWVAG